MRKHGRDDEAAGALDVHEERVGGLDQALELVLPLLVGARWVQQILGHFWFFGCVARRNFANARSGGGKGGWSGQGKSCER